MKRLIWLIIVGFLIGVPSVVIGQTTQCNLGWSNDPLSNSAQGIGGWYADGTSLGSASWQIKVTMTSLPDPYNNNQTAPNIQPDYPQQTVYSSINGPGCILAQIAPDGLLNGGGAWPSNQGVSNGLFQFTLWSNWYGGGGWQAQGTFNAYLISGTWSLNPPPTAPPWTGTLNNSGAWDPTGGNYINNNVVVTVTSAGVVCADGVHVKLTQTSTGANVSANTVNGRVVFSPVSQDSYTVTLSGTVVQGSQNVTYSGGTSIVKGNAEIDLGMVCDANGNLTGTTINGVTASGSTSGSGSGNPTQSYWQGIFQALFVPSQTTLTNLQSSFASFANWGPIGFINSINSQVALASGTPDPYWDSAPGISFPYMDPATGLLTANTGTSRSDASLTNQWSNEPIFQNVRVILGALVYLYFGMGLFKTIKPKFRF